MEAGVLTKVSARNAAEVCRSFELSKGSRKLLRDDLTPRQFVDRLMEAEAYPDAIDFLAHALPVREAIWWACLGVRHAKGAQLPPPQIAALKAAVEWVLDPQEPKRRAAETAGEAADFSTPAGCVAFAVFGSGGSLSPPNLPEVPPDAFMTAKAVSGSLALAAIQEDPALTSEVQRELIELGLAIAEGKVVVPTSTKETGPASAIAKRP